MLKITIRTFLAVAFLLLLVQATAYSRNTDDISFDRLTTEDGLSQDTVFCIWEDQKGFMWFGTQDGLNRYDGYDFIQYKNHPKDENSLSGNFISGIYEDAAGFLWISTRNDGLNRYDPRTDSFTRYQHKPDNPRSLCSNYITAICGGSKGLIWIGTFSEGMDRFDTETGIFMHFRHEPGNPDSLSSDKIESICQDQDGIIWIGTKSMGLCSFDPNTEIFKTFRHHPDDPGSLSHDNITVVYADKDKTLWVGTEKRGLNRFNPESKTFTRYLHDPDRPESLGKGDVHSINRDFNGILRAGTRAGGLNVFDPLTGKIIHYQNIPDDPRSLSQNDVISIYTDREKNLWLGTKGGGINKYSPAKNKFVSYGYEPGVPDTVSAENIRSVYEDRKGIIWFGTYGGGLNAFDPETGKMTYYLNNPEDPHSLSDNWVYAIYEDRNGSLWFGTCNGGLNRFDRDTKRFARYRHDPNKPESLSDDYIYSIYEDRSGRFWVGTNSGPFNRLDRITGSVKHYPEIEKPVLCIYEDRKARLWVAGTGGLYKYASEADCFVSYGQISGNPEEPGSIQINGIFEDQQGILWLGTEEGLGRFDPEAGKTGLFTEFDGLPNNVIQCILPDTDGNLWLSSNNGLSVFNPVNRNIRNYDTDDGLQSRGFNRNACVKNRQEEMIFGGLKGYNIFHPADIRDNPYIPPVVLTAFKRFNETVAAGSDSLLKNAIWETDKLELSHKDYIISFEFAALSYTAPHKNRYRYILEGLEKKWNETDSKRRFATYTNLPAGNYVFRVQASNNDGIWNNEGIALNITVIPPWWKTIWCISLFILSGIAVLFCGFRWRINAVKRQNRLLEIQVLERTGELTTKTEELALSYQELMTAKSQAETSEKTKSEFLANMSHEIRTPMNSILGFLELSLEDFALPEIHRKNLRTALNSAKSLLTLINDILDISKLESGRLELEKQAFDLGQIMEDTLQIFEMKCREKGLKLSCHIHPDIPLYFTGDSARLRQILINLLGNALKFTEKGEIDVTVSPMTEKDRPDMIRFSVSDTGIGILPERLSCIFDPFTQADSSTSRRFGGTGLGTTISKQLTELMGGEIWVESEAGKGSIFHFTVQMKASEKKPPTEKSDYLPAGNNLSQQVRKNLCVLVAEDIKENMMLAKVRLKKAGHRVISAENGSEAVAAYERENPDIILMDVHMPEMDGLDATRRIRELENGLDRHVPIVALTASIMKEEQKTCLEAGMDAVAGKPVDFEELFNIMEKIVTQGAGTKKIFQPDLHPDLTPSPMKGIDYEKGLLTWIDSREYQKALRSFCRDYENAADKMRQFIQSGDREGAFRIAHALKGVAGNLSVTDVFHIAENLNAALTNKSDMVKSDMLKPDMLKSDDELIPMIESLETSLETAVTSINQLTPEPDKKPDFLIKSDFSAPTEGFGSLKELFQELMASFEEYNPFSAEPFLEALGNLLPSNELDPICRRLDAFDFDGAREETENLIKKLGI